VEGHPAYICKAAELTRFTEPGVAAMREIARISAHGLGHGRNAKFYFADARFGGAVTVLTVEDSV
jgi:hypothetical protein